MAESRPSTSTTKHGTMILLFRDGKVLLGRRENTTYAAGHFGTPGGRVEPDETPEACAARETEEECGLAARGLRLFCVLSPPDAPGWTHHVFVADAAPGEPVAAEPELCASWEWYAPDALPSPMVPSVALALQALQADIHKAAGIVIRGKKLLVTRSRGKGFFISPGGKLETGETSTSALVRELGEELGIVVRAEALRPFGTFVAEATGSTRIVHLDAFIVDGWTGEPAPSNEVEELAWIGATVPMGMELGSIFAHEVLPRLVAEGLVAD